MGSNVKLDVRAYPLENAQGSTKAFVSVAFNDIVAIRGIRVVDGQNGLFVTMPQSKSEKDGKTEYHDIAFPKSAELRKEVNRAVLAEYAKSQSAEYKPNQNGRDAEKQEQQDSQTGGDVKLVVWANPFDSPQSSTKAFANVLFKNGDEDLIVINGIRVVDGQNGLFVTMPQSKQEKPDGTTEYHDIAFPLTNDLRKELNTAVLAEYARSMSTERTTERKPSFSDRLAEGHEKSAKVTEQKPAKPAAKTSPGLGD